MSTHNQQLRNYCIVEHGVLLMEWYQLQTTTPGTRNVIQYAMPMVLI
jgi:hypothetical protein